MVLSIQSPVSGCEANAMMLYKENIAIMVIASAFAVTITILHAHIPSTNRCSAVSDAVCILFCFAVLMSFSDVFPIMVQEHLVFHRQEIFASGLYR